MEKRPIYQRDPLASCFVPTCKNRALLCPDKYFFYVPKSTRIKWCSAVNKQNVPKWSIYVCEDHLNLEEDIINYQKWINGIAKRPRLKPEVPKTLKNIGITNLPSTSSAETQNINYQISNLEEKSEQCTPQHNHKTIQVNPVMVHDCVGVNLLKRKQSHLIEEESPDDYIPSPIGSIFEFKTKDSSVPTSQDFSGRKFILNLIEANPFEYLGIVKQYYWIVEYIEKSCNIQSLHVIVTLYKIKNNDTFKRMKDLFEMSIATLWRVFFKTLKLMSLFLKQLLFLPSSVDIKRNLPPAFRCNADYASVQSIIDAFEIEIEKPTKPVQQTLTWSKYKHCNTIKYLIGATPHGYINFVSEGYSGRISDLNLVEQSGFLETVPANCTIIADRGFKHLESHLVPKNVKVLRPPSVLKDVKMTKSEVIESEVEVASLRIHIIERVIRRVCLFKLLKPHSVVNNKLVNILDDAVIIACGMINLQTLI